jgi:microcystin-dependent protein
MFADLFAAIGTTWGSGNGSTTFNLPSLNGYWLKGSSTAGSNVSAGLPNITGSIGSVNHRPNTCTGAFAEKNFSGSKVQHATDDVATTPQLDASRSNSIYGNSTTVQPPSKTVRYMIKY